MRVCRKLGVPASLPSALLYAAIALLAVACERPDPVAVPPRASEPAPTAAPPTASAATSAPLPPPEEASPPPAPEVRLTVHLVPIGSVPLTTMEQTAAGLRDHAPVDPVIETAPDVPASSRSPRAGAYKARELLSWLDTLPLPSGGKIMGVTEADIVTPKGKHPIWGILGMGSIDGRCSVISTYRMRRRWENGGAPEALVRERLWKIAIHELGHTLGLEHCPRVGCIMEDGQGTVKTVDRDEALCSSCAESFASALQTHASR